MFDFTLTQYYVFLGLIVVLTFILILVIALVVRNKNKRIRENIYSGKFISADEFERNWISVKYGKKGVAGYKYNDGPGCYVIMIYSHEPAESERENYENIYIGQSVNVCKRVHNHLNGKGNGDVYADRKMGKPIYVHFERCPEKDMNKLEKNLIAAYKATDSYNTTRGGGKRR